MELALPRSPGYRVLSVQLCKCRLALAPLELVVAAGKPDFTCIIEKFN